MVRVCTINIDPTMAQINNKPGPWVAVFYTVGFFLVETLKISITNSLFQSIGNLCHDTLPARMGSFREFPSTHWNPSKKKTRDWVKNLTPSKVLFICIYLFPNKRPDAPELAWDQKKLNCAAKNQAPPGGFSMGFFLAIFNGFMIFVMVFHPKTTVPSMRGPQTMAKLIDNSAIYMVYGNYNI